MRAIVLALVGACLFGPAADTLGAGGKSGEKKKRLLVITESRGFRHGCVTRKVNLAPDVDPKQLPKIPGLQVQTGKPGKDGKPRVTVFFTDRIGGPNAVEVKDGARVIARAEPCLVEKTLMELADKHGFEVVCSQDSRKEITAENLRNFDAVFFYTTGELPISDTQKADLLAFVRGGKGFAGSHSATDTFYKWKEYGELIGAYFQSHPPGIQKIRVIVEDPKHPATRHLGESFMFDDEIYQFKGPYSRQNVRVLMRVDMDSTKNLWRKDGDNPLAWCREYGKGYVFYTALGHRDEVWRDPRFQQHLVGGLRYVFGLEKADATPSGVKK
jgi:type 1 glutamine amidotransferase